MGPLLRAVLDEDLLLRVSATGPMLTASGPKLRHGAHEARVHIVGERSANLTLNDGEAMVYQSFLRMLQLLELHEGEVKVLEKRSTQGETKISQPLTRLKLSIKGNTLTS